ncbi:hypothetical protein DRO97_06035 [Archaeoglobales archaeon]|nr:MAG: hypothetical protein DRO97_06035 [Archaeoglobales archaeon]
MSINDYLAGKVVAEVNPITNIDPLYVVIGIIFVIGFSIALIFIFRKFNVLSAIRSLFRRERVDRVVEEVEVKPDITLPEEKERAYAEKLAQYEERLRQMAERAKKAEEAYDELMAQLKETKKEREEVSQKLQEKDKEIDEMLKESNKLVKWMAMRFNKGEYIPAVMWTKRGNPMLLKFVCSIAFINGGWRALLVDRLTTKPEKGEWYPSLDKPGAEFIFRDQYGFNPDDPRHTVLFDINFRDWEEDLKITRDDPRAKPVAFMFGIDEDGNPVHRLEYGAPIDIRQLRSENRALKRQIGGLRYRLSKIEEDLWNARYNLEIERDRREHLERENKLLKARMSEMEEAFAIQTDESEILRNFARSMKRREYAFKRKFRELEDEYIAEVITPQLRSIPGAEYLEKMGRDKTAQIFSKLYPIALSESKTYGIDTTGKSMFDVVGEWLLQKWEREQKDLSAVLEDYGLREEIADIIRSSYT